jgi:hypothetical protein
VEDFGKRKFSTLFIPHCLTDEQKALRLKACEEFIQSVHDDRSMLDSVATGDEKWCFQCDPETKDKAWSGTHQALQDTKNFSFKSQKTEMLVTFFDSEGIIHKEFVPPGQTVK